MFNSNIHIKGSDINPLIGESLGRTGIGPCRKNFVMPNELALKLIIKEINGRAWLKLVKEGTVYPAEFCG